MTADGFYVTPVYGFRTWKVNPRRARLGALTRNEAWPVGKPLLSRHHDQWGTCYSACVPGQPCRSCGIYAFENYGEVQDHQWDGCPAWCRAGGGGPGFDFSRVRGIVAGWGRVTLCTRGWRAGKAYPLALLDWQTPAEQYGPAAIRWHTIMCLVAHCYDIPVVPSVDDLVEVAGDVGAVSLSEWREAG